MNITRHKIVGLTYTMTDETGRQIEAREPHVPLYYLHGEGLLLPGVEDALEGKQAGDRFDVTVAPEDAYGRRDTELVRDVPREELFIGAENVVGQPLEEGMQLKGTVEQVATIVKVRPDFVTVDANHPLAGKTLTVTGSVVNVRDPLPEEVALGRASEQDDATYLVHLTMREQRDTE